MEKDAMESEYAHRKYEKITPELFKATRGPFQLFENFSYPASNALAAL